MLGAVAVLGAAVPAGADDPPRDDQQVAVVADDGRVATRQVSDDELAAMEAQDPTAVVTRGRRAAAELAQSVPKVGAPSLWGIGRRGAGRVIVVIDTGVDAAAGVDVVGQACFAATQTAEGLQGHCGPAGDQLEAYDATCFALEVCEADDVLDPQAARPCTEPVEAKDCAHGTAVASVAARQESPQGVAPDAGVYAIQVFDPTGRSADFVDILLALDHAADLAEAGVDVAAVNLSLSSSSTFPTHCDVGGGADPDAVAFRSAFARLESLGIPSTVATGNDYATGGVGLPACVSNAIAVGASDLDDDIADFSNRGPTLELVAPGADEGNGSGDPMEIPGSGVTQWSGTSFAAPQVAAAYALLQPEYPKASVRQLLAHLRSVGAPATDPDTGARYPRLRLLPPAQGLPAGLLFPADAGAAGTARAATGDFDGDGFADVLAHAPGSAPDRISFGTSSWRLTARSYAVGGSYAPLVGNFRGSAADDIFWYAPGAATDHLWVGGASRTFASTPSTVNGTYLPLLGDFDGDGFDDIFWYSPGQGADSLFYGGPSGFTSRPSSVVGVYRVAVGDMDGDGRDDILFHGPGGAPDALWRGTATRGTWSTSALSIGGTNVVGAGDFDGDGDDDVLLYQAGPGSDAIWRGGPEVGSSGATGGFSPLAVSVSGTYRPSIADVDGDGRDDVLWYAPGPVGDHLWLGRAAGAPTSRPLSVSGTYVPLLADLDASGGADVVWFQSAATTTPVWWSHG